MSITLTLIGQAISFALFVLFCMKFVWPPLISALRDRQKNISDGLEAAEKGKKDLEAAQESADKIVKEAKEQAASIVANANSSASGIIEDAKKQAEVEKQRIVASATEEINMSAQKTRSELGGALTDLVVQGVSKIIGKEVDMSAHKASLDDLSSTLKK